MKALRHIAGVILASVGILITLVFIYHFSALNSKAPLWAIGLLFVVLGLLPLGGAFILLRTHITAPSKPCPKCGSVERQRAVVLKMSPSWRVRYLGGWLLPALWGASRQQQFRCIQCEGLYLSDTRSSRVSSLLLWIFILIWMLGVIVGICRGR